jgi:hypothetical protein
MRQAAGRQALEAVGGGYMAGGSRLRKICREGNLLRLLQSVIMHYAHTLMTGSVGQIKGATHPLPRVLACILSNAAVYLGLI